MTTTNQMDRIDTLRIEQEIEINAGVEDVYASILALLGPESEMPDGSKYPMVFEAWPGGRWYRDLGKNTGHFWGHVQVIKPPPHPKPLIEIAGPLFMSYPAISHVQYRILPDGGRCILRLTHRAMGLIDPEHAQGVHEGWAYELSKIKEKAERVLA
ncbi:MAG: SRPBCC domain-containing protein [Phycisphaeraceae bacterium]|nr:SRPBCC domain-containing protein [Phycisphaeraceae bacterium]QYK48934.1 MAG: SRPBCC domain-containing protein [Phycisphaeraceae bacterium]